MLVLLPTSSSKLTAQCQGPYSVVKQVGKVNYLLKVHGRKKKSGIYHVNMLQKWHTVTATGFLAREVSEEQEDIPFWNDGDSSEATVGDSLTSVQLQELNDLLKKYKLVFQTLPGHTSLTEHHIITEQAQPVRQAHYRIPHAFREEVNHELKEILRHGVIEHSTSDWASPMVTVQKKDKSLRLCVDYRCLNVVSKGDAYPMPRIDELIDRVGRAKYIMTPDLTKGYWQVPVAIEDRPKTAFTTACGRFQFTRMPFGLQGAPATFQRMVDILLDGLGEFSST